MKILAIDPSSTVIGWAVMTGASDLAALAKIAIDGSDKVRAVVTAARQLANQLKPRGIEHVVIEIPAPQAPVFSRAGQATYGMAVGIVVQAIATEIGLEHMTCVASDVWTRQVKKELRQRWIAQRFRQYDVKHDSGGDISDAIALGEWWFTERLTAGDKPIGQRPPRKKKLGKRKAKAVLWA